MRVIIIAMITLCSIQVSAATKDCGVVSIKKILTGPRHGAMMQVSNTSCGSQGWVCLDPDAEHLSPMESDRLFTFILASKMANKRIRLSTYNNVFSHACGSIYPVVEDVRTP